MPYLIFNKKVGTGVVSVDLIFGDNSTFTNGLGDWYSGNAGVLTNPVGRLRVANGYPSWGRAVYSFSTVIGTQYEITGDVFVGNGGHVRFGKTDNSDGSELNPVVNNYNSDTVGTSTIFTATATTSYIKAEVGDTITGHYVEIDNIGVTEV